MQVSEAIVTRSSCRAYGDKPVSREILEQIMDLTRRAPSAINLQPWQFTVVMNDEVRRLGKKLSRALGERGFSCKPDNTEPLPEVYGERQAELGRLMSPLMREAGLDRDFINTGSLNFYGAPAVVVGTLDGAFPPERALDLGFALGWLLLAAAEQGLSSCPIGLITSYGDVIKDFLNIDPKRKVVLAVALGYADPDNPINRMRSPRAEMDEVVRWY
ncbi:MAG: nitroreductase [Desulfarculaceae bacterium]|nr:nitroreductase [Desulfarculaceae bacterium]MCF8072308.1 nitroreductase [Desulfarculaceae bacterium]MCF8100229.1 nitroreductase [Desulfarculaceae bacterium]MCF8116198.1 nitroreductase [Desulfarculaceae bacterium]